MNIPYFIFIFVYCQSVVVQKDHKSVRKNLNLQIIHIPSAKYSLYNIIFQQKENI